LLFQGLTLATAGGSATFAVTLRDEFGNTLLASDTSGNIAIRHRSSGDIYTDDIITTKSALVGAGGVMDTSYISVTRAGANFSRPDAISVPKLNEEKVLLVKKPNFAKPTQPTKALTPCTANSLHILCFSLRKARLLCPCVISTRAGTHPLYVSGALSGGLSATYYASINMESPAKSVQFSAASTQDLINRETVGCLADTER